MKNKEMLRKLLALALNPAAAEGEWHTAAVKLFSRLRIDGTQPDDVSFDKLEPSGDFYSQFAARRAAQEQARAYARNDPPPPPTAPDEPRMPFGKHKGKLITELPLQYLKWINEWLGKIDDNFVELKAQIKEELRRRQE